MIDAKWPEIRQGFAGFEPTRVAGFGAGDVERLLADPRMVRSRAKIEATIDNAQAMLELDAEHGSFRRYLQSHESFEETVADLKRQFRFIGERGAYHFLYIVAEPVPPHEEWFAHAPSRTGRRASPATSLRS